jgi:hypothetical protein
VCSIATIGHASCDCADTGDNCDGRQAWTRTGGPESFYPRGVRPVRPVREPLRVPRIPVLRHRARATESASSPSATARGRALGVFVGRAVLRSAGITCWPALRPDVIWVASVPL